METIDLTDGQLQTLLNMTGGDPELHSPRTRSLVLALHRVTMASSKWVTKMSEEDIDTALHIFEAYQLNHRTSASAQYLRYFVRGSRTAQRLYADRKEQQTADVPRETSDGANG